MALYGQEHVERYIATDGREGHEWRGAHTLILTTTGRRSGQPRSHPLIYGRHGDDYLVVASNGGAPKHPAWYLNLNANPDVEIQVKADRMTARARTATPEEKAELWPIMTREWPDYDRYQGRTDRQIPLVVLEPTPCGTRCFEGRTWPHYGTRMSDPGRRASCSAPSSGTAAVCAFMGIQHSGSLGLRRHL